ncbi:MAG: response regulator [Deltaproteobacteria bacterium]|nr:MAG: response regulator [Deltaproteobacteria bacterium]
MSRGPRKIPGPLNNTCSPRLSCAACIDKGNGEGVVLADRPKIIAILNTNQEVLDLVRESLQQAGYATVVAHIDDLKRGRLDMIQFVEEHKPDVIVYDVAPPYDTNWTFLRLMRNSKVMQGRAFVVTTTNKRALEELIGPNDVIELLCKPYDLQQLVEACTSAMEKQVAAKTA